MITGKTGAPKRIKMYRKRPVSIKAGRPKIFANTPAQDALLHMLAMGKPVDVMSIDKQSYDCDWFNCRQFADVLNIHYTEHLRLCKAHAKELEAERERRGK